MFLWGLIRSLGWVYDGAPCDFRISPNFADRWQTIGNIMSHRRTAWSLMRLAPLVESLSICCVSRYLLRRDSVVSFLWRLRSIRVRTVEGFGSWGMYDVMRFIWKNADDQTAVMVENNIDWARASECRFNRINQQEAHQLVGRQNAAPL